MSSLCLGWNRKAQADQTCDDYYFLWHIGFVLVIQINLVAVAEGKNVVFDVDVVGGINIKKFYGDRALSIFIQPPSVEVLRQRLTDRGTDAPDVIECRLNKAEYELSFTSQFDIVIVNDNLEDAQKQALQAIQNFTAH